MKRIVKVTSAQVLAAQLLIKLRTHRGEYISPATYAIANAKKPVVAEVVNEKTYDEGYSVGYKAGYDDGFEDGVTAERMERAYDDD